MVLKADPYIFGLRGIRKKGENKVLIENPTFYFFAPPLNTPLLVLCTCCLSAWVAKHKFFPHENMPSSKNQSWLAPFSPMWSHLALFDPIWLHCALFGPIWFLLVLFGPICPRLAPFGFIWPHLAPFGLVWPRLAPIDHFSISRYFKVLICQGTDIQRW